MSSSGFILHLYRKDKLAGVMREELSNTARARTHLENLITMGDSITIDRVKNSEVILFITDSPCDPDRSHSVISSRYEKVFRDLEISPESWLKGLDLFKACQEINAAPTLPEEQRQTRILASQIPFMIPYIAVLFTGHNYTRFGLLSMEGFDTAAGNTLFLLDKDGQIIWTGDGPDYTKEALADTHLNQSLLTEIAHSSAAGRKPKLREIADRAILSFASIPPNWTLVSLSYRPTALKPVTFAIRQVIYLITGFAFLFLLLSKFGAEYVTRPLRELRTQAERIGRGEFTARFDTKGDSEIVAVKSAFNVMAEKVLLLLEETRQSAELQAELELAQQMQLLLVPPNHVQVGDHGAFSYLKYASRCGGDWWGYLEVPRPGRKPLLVALIGDVTGHGTPSALITATARGAVSMLARTLETQPALAEDPNTFLRRLNEVIHDAAKGTISMTLFAAVLDPEAGKLTCANAGHNFPYLLLPGLNVASPSQIKVVGESSIPLGVSLDTVYDGMQTFPWVPGARLFLYTDGLIDCQKDSRNVFDRKHLRRALQAHSNLGAEALLRQLLRDRELLAAGATQPDDVTAVVFELRGDL